jgi:hypothetical protein
MDAFIDDGLPNLHQLRLLDAGLCYTRIGPSSSTLLSLSLDNIEVNHGLYPDTVAWIAHP